MAKHRVEKPDDVQNVLTAEEETDLMHQAQQNVKQGHNLIKKMRGFISDVFGETSEPQKQILDKIEFKHIQDTVKWLEQLITQLNSMKQYVQEKLSKQHTNSKNSDVKDACFDAYETLITEYDTLLKNWQPVLNQYKQQQLRLQDIPSKQPDNVNMASILNVGMPAPKQNHPKIREWMQHAKKYYDKKRFTATELDTVVNEVEIIMRKVQYEETIDLLEQLIIDLQKAQPSIISLEKRNKFKKVIQRYERKLQHYKRMRDLYATLVAADVALEKAGLAVPTPQP